MNYEMPKAGVGEIVLFRPHEGAEASPAIVCKVGSRTLNLFAMSGELGVVLKPSVHHVGDEGVNEFQEWKRYGFWEHCPKDPALAMLSERVSLLEKKIAAVAPKKG
jgi:hypothetical protein